jgi:DMSO/TMAO reductase YedYZ molybdopterin-dependent catalytic subunit
MRDAVVAFRAALLVTVLEAIGRFAWEGPYLPELIAQKFFTLIPVWAFTPLFRTFGYHAKYHAFGAMIAVEVAGLTLVGTALRRWTRRLRMAGWGLPGIALSGAGLITVSILAGLLPLVDAGLAGRMLTGGVWVTGLTFFVLSGCFIAVLVRGLSPGSAWRSDRRRFLGRILASLGILAIGRVIDAAALGMRRSLARAQDIWSQLAGLSSEVTPVEKFYVVSKNIFDPVVDAKSWAVAVKGMVERPYSLTLDELRQLPSVSKPHTLMCISNEIGGDLISNAWWKGVPLKVLLEKAGVLPGTTKLIVRARDGYSDSFPLGIALLDGTMVAYEMNGKPLERQHGYPARMLVMGLYGIKNVKWVSEFELVGHDYKGYWQARGWTDTAVYKTFSRIDLPSPGATLKRDFASWIAGVAFGGDRGIQRVEVSVDAGQSWRPARVKVAMGTHTWVLWAFQWRPTAAGTVTLMVRAVDGIGVVQPTGPRPPLPDGVEGLHSIAVNVT